MIERTFVLLKPDAFDSREVTGTVHLELEGLGLKLGRWAVVLKLPERLVRAHYAKYVDEPFFPGLLAYMTRGTCVISVWEGEDAVARVRTLIGATRPDEADPKSLRGRFGRIVDGRIENVIHASATPEEAEAEIALFFAPGAAFE